MATTILGGYLEIIDDQPEKTVRTFRTVFKHGVRMGEYHTVIFLLRFYSTLASDRA